MHTRLDEVDCMPESSVLAHLEDYDDGNNKAATGHYIGHLSLSHTRPLTTLITTLYSPPVAFLHNKVVLGCGEFHTF